MKFSSSARFGLLIFSLFTLFTFLIFWPVFLGKVNLNGNLLVSFYPPFGENLPFKNTGWDQLRIYFPFYKVTFEQLRNFSIPLWTPYAFSGHPHAADFQSAVFYPLNIFGLFLPQIEFWHLLRLSSTILASFFTFLYLRSIKLSKIASTFGAITFGFSPFILTWGEEVVMSPHSIVWLPLILFGVEKWVIGSKKWSLLIVGLATAATFLAGYMQTTIYLFIFVGFYLLFGVGVKKLFFERRGLVLLGTFLLGAGIAAIQLLPSAEVFFNSARAQTTLQETLFEFLVPIEGLLTYFAPDFFGSPATNNFFREGSAQYYEAIMFVGVGALMLATYAFISKPRDRMVLFLLLFAVISASTTLDLPTSKAFISLPIPFLSTSIANRVLFIPAFCIAILASMGMDMWLKAKSRQILKVVFVFGVIYLALFASLFAIRSSGSNYFEHAHFVSSQNVITSLRNLVIPFGIFVATAGLIVVGSFRQNVKKYAAILIIIVAALHIFRFSQKYFSFSEREVIFPENPVLSYIAENQGYFRSWSVGDAFLENNFASQYGIYWPEGYDSLNNKRYGEFTFAMQGNELDGFIFRADAGLGRGKAIELFDSSTRRRLVDMVGVKYVIGKEDHREILEENNFVEVFDGGSDYLVFENLQVMPRAFLASNYEGVPETITSQELIAKISNREFDFRNSLILEKDSTISPQFGEGSAEILSYEPQEVVVKTESEQPKLLFLSDNYYPGWKATVDGDEVEVMRANYTFRAVALTPGGHEVRFYFDSLSFKVGALISVLSLGLLLSLTLVRNRLLD